MSSELDDSLDALGYAQVICELVPQAAASDSAAEETERHLTKHFTVPSADLARGLAAAAVRHSSSRARTARRAPAPGLPNVRVYPYLNLAVGYASRSNVEALSEDARIKRIVKAPELSLIRPVAIKASAARPGVTWGIERLKVPALWDAGIDGTGIIVGHLDTGIDGAHPALKGAIHSFAEFDLAGRRVDGAKTRDSGEHGTHTAGTIAGRTTRRGRFGVAPGCTLASAMVIEGGDVVTRILGGMDWIVGEGAKILSMSLGLRGYTPAFQVVTDALRRADVLPVIAVGNEYANSSRSPGNYVNVLSIGACDERDEVADFSGSQRFARENDPIVPDLVAPGVSVFSCVPNKGFAEMDGSSMATPHIGGLAALLRQADRTATADDIERVILESCTRPAGMAQDRANRGVPDAVEAYTALTGAPPAAAAAAA